MSNIVNGKMQTDSVGSIGGDASAANQTSGGQKTQVTDGTNSVGVSTVSGEYALKVDVVQNVAGGYAEDTPSVAGESITMAGVVRNDTRGPLAGTDGDRTELQVNSSGDLRVDVASALPAGSNTVGKVKITDGVDDATVRDVTGAKSLDVSIVDASGAHITSFGGGTQYTEADVDATITGTAIMWEDAADTLTPVNVSKPLPVTQSGVATSAKQDTAQTTLDTIAGAVKAEDAASANAHTGIGALAVQKATPANTAGTDGDYEFLQMSAGRLWSSTVVTDVVPGTAATNLGKAEDAAHASGDVGVMALGVRTDTPAARSGTDGDYEPFQIKGGALVVDSTRIASPTSGGPANVSSSATNVTLLASNTARLQATLYNDSTSNCYVKLGATASSSSFHTKMAPGGYYELPQTKNGVYTGIIDGIWVSANGSMRVGEIT